MSLSDTVLIYSTTSGARVQYAAEVLLHSILGLKWSLTCDLREFDLWRGARINYSRDSLTSNEVFIPADGFLLNQGITEFSPDYIIHEGLTALFPNDRMEGDLPFDLLAMTFYLATRYEEYLPFEADQHGRFSARQSISSQLGFLQQPILHQWGQRLAGILQEKFPALVVPPVKFQIELTYDIDHAWAYRNKGWARAIGSWIKDLMTGNFKIAGDKLAVLVGRHKDPFDVFDQLMELPAGTRFFFLLGDWGTFDKNIPWQNDEFQKLIQRIAARFSVGIHPSYQSQQKGLPQLEKEISRLHQITGERVIQSRQHFLLLRFPDTYRRLLELGIQHDFSLGYADQPGFRAGLATPFLWYDLEKEEVTKLLLHPFQVMDVTLREYLHLSPSQGLAMIQQLKSEVEATGGIFCTLWHNSSFSPLHGWEGWEKVHDRLKAWAQ